MADRFIDGGFQTSCVKRASHAHTALTASFSCFPSRYLDRVARRLKDLSKVGVSLEHIGSSQSIGDPFF